MQKQEIKTKRRSRELEGPASWREHRAMMSQHDRQRAAKDRQVRTHTGDTHLIKEPHTDPAARQCVVTVCPAGSGPEGEAGL